MSGENGESKEISQLSEEETTEVFSEENEEKSDLVIPEINTREDARKLREVAEQKEIEIHLQEEAEKIKDQYCICGEKLDITPEDFMQKGSKNKKYLCLNCNRYSSLQVDYKDEPEKSFAKLKLRTGNFAWESDTVGSLSDEHLAKWIAEEDERIKQNQSRFPDRNDQILVRALNSVMNPKKKRGRKRKN